LLNENQILGVHKSSLFFKVLNLRAVSATDFILDDGGFAIQQMTATRQVGIIEELMQKKIP
jgi:hypothetical protein